MSPTRLLRAASRVDDYFAGRLGAAVSDEIRREILAELSAAVAEAKARKDGRLVQFLAAEGETVLAYGLYLRDRVEIDAAIFSDLREVFTRRGVLVTGESLA